MKSNLCRLHLAIFAVVVLFSLQSLAQQEDVAARRQFSEKARARSYDGGIDEQSLIVQQNLVEPRTDGSELVLQKKILGSGEEQSGGESTSPAATDETSSGF